MALAFDAGGGGRRKEEEEQNAVSEWAPSISFDFRNGIQWGDNKPEPSSTWQPGQPLSGGVYSRDYYEEQNEDNSGGSDNSWEQIVAPQEDNGPEPVSTPQPEYNEPIDTGRFGPKLSPVENLVEPVVQEQTEEKTPQGYLRAERNTPKTEKNPVDKPETVNTPSETYQNWQEYLRMQDEAERANDELFRLSNQEPDVSVLGNGYVQPVTPAFDPMQYLNDARAQVAAMAANLNHTLGAGPHEPGTMIFPTHTGPILPRDPNTPVLGSQDVPSTPVLPYANDVREYVTDPALQFANDFANTIIPPAFSGYNQPVNIGVPVVPNSAGPLPKTNIEPNSAGPLPRTSIEPNSAGPLPSLIDNYGERLNPSISDIDEQLALADLVNTPAPVSASENNLGNFQAFLELGRDQGLSGSELVEYAADELNRNSAGNGYVPTNNLRENPTAVQETPRWTAQELADINRLGRQYGIDSVVQSEPTRDIYAETYQSVIANGGSDREAEIAAAKAVEASDNSDPIGNLVREIQAGNVAYDDAYGDAYAQVISAGGSEREAEAAAMKAGSQAAEQARTYNGPQYDAGAQQNQRYVYRPEASGTTNTPSPVSLSVELNPTPAPQNNPAPTTTDMFIPDSVKFAQERGAATNNFLAEQQANRGTSSGSSADPVIPEGSKTYNPSYEGNQGSKVVKAPYKTGGYTEEELAKMGNRPYEIRNGKYLYEGYYEWNGKYYPVDQDKANYYNYYGTYSGYTDDKKDYYNTFGTYYGYRPGWRTAGRAGGGGGSRGGGGGGGSYGGGSYGSSAPSTKTQSDDRQYNIMKNWSY